MDYRWIGYNRVLENGTDLVTPLKHRIVHTLRLDGRKYYYEKLYALQLMYSCELYHPKFLKDYIDFYYNMDGFLKDEPFTEKNNDHPKLNLCYSSIADDSELVLFTIIKILENWDKQYSLS